MNELFREKIARLYCVVFFLLLIYRYFSHGFFFQVTPVFFYNKPDFTTWLVLTTKIHLLLIKSKEACVMADVIFAGLPFAYLFFYKRQRNFSILLAWFMLLFNLFYFIIYCSFPTDSLEGKTAYFFFPFLFTALSLKNYWFIFQGIRYFFLFFFFSSGIWKITQGGLFHIDQMSSILLFQHKELLAADTTTWLVSLYKWLIDNPSASYFLYAFAALSELSFVTGFFTKRFDKILMGLYIIFLVMDWFIMRIGYWHTLPFLFTLAYSKIEFPGTELNSKLSFATSVNHK